MTERFEFETHLLNLRKIILDGISYFTVFKALDDEYEKSKQHRITDKGFLWQYYGFFGPARNALLWSTLLQLSKAFDKNSKSISFGNLLKLALETKKELIPFSTRKSLRAIFNNIENNTELVTKLRGYRNQRLAHFDPNINGNMNLSYDEVLTLIEETKSIFNSLKYSFEGKYDDFNDIMIDVYRHTSEVIRIVNNAIASTG